MTRCKVNFKFSTVVAYAGQNHYIVCDQADDIDLEDWLIGELAVQVPGALTPVQPPAPVPEPDVVMGEGLVPTAETRQVVATKKTTTKKKAT